MKNAKNLNLWRIWHEKNIPTKPAKKEEQAWVPTKNENKRRSECFISPKSKRPLETNGQRRSITSRWFNFMSGQTLTKRDVIRGRGRFHEVYSRGKRLEGKHILCFVAKNSSNPTMENPQVTMGISISQAMKRAVDRNRIKRSIRESYRVHKQGLNAAAERLLSSISVLFVYPVRRNAITHLPPQREIEMDIIHIISVVNTLKTI